MNWTKIGHFVDLGFKIHKLLNEIGVYCPINHPLISKDLRGLNLPEVIEKLQLRDIVKSGNITCKL